MSLNLAEPSSILRKAIAEMRALGSESFPHSDVASVFWNLDSVEAGNMRGRSICGSAAHWLFTYLPAHLKEHHGITCDAFMATSSVGNGCFHHFNMVKIDNMQPMICDLTASQYFSRPISSLAGHAYFVGTRRELQELVSVTQRQTWVELNKAFPARGFRHLWDVDYHAYKDYDFRAEMHNHMNKKSEVPCLLTESLYYPMEITWGARRSHLLNRHMDEKVRTELSRRHQRAGIEDLTEDRDPEIANLVTSLSIGRLSLGDGPR